MNVAAPAANLQLNSPSGCEIRPPKLRAADLTERAAAQSHFRDVCDLLVEPAPSDTDPKGEWYAFEKGATKTTGGEGWADVWKRVCFGGEYKSKGKDLKAAFAQLQDAAA